MSCYEMLTYRDNDFLIVSTLFILFYYLLTSSYCKCDTDQWPISIYLMYNYFQILFLAEISILFKICQLSVQVLVKSQGAMFPSHAIWFLLFSFLMLGCILKNLTKVCPYILENKSLKSLQNISWKRKILQRSSNRSITRCFRQSLAKIL